MPKYERGTENLHSYKVKLLQSLPESECKVLELGGGSGTVAARIAGLLGQAVTGIDVSKRGVQRLKQRGIDGIVADVDDSIPIEDRSYDVVWCTDLIEHVASPMRLLNAIHRVLKPSETLLLSTPNSAYFGFRLLHLLGRTCSEIQHPHHVHFFSLRMLVELLETTGFETVEVMGRNMPIVFPARVLSPLTSIPGVTQNTVSSLLRKMGLEEADTLTRGTVVHWSFFARRGITLLADQFLVKARKKAKA
jgi:SAM-dependent methyltransferase